MWRAASAGLWAVSLASAGVWLVQGRVQDSMQALRSGSDAVVVTWLLVVVLGLALTVGSVVWRQATVLPLALAWTGGEWQLRRGWACGLELDDLAFEVCAPQVMIDLGPWMLLRLGAPPSWEGADWVAVSQRQTGRAWHRLRVALYGAPPSRLPSEVR